MCGVASKRSRSLVVLCIISLASFLWGACGGTTTTTSAPTATISSSSASVSRPSTSLQLTGLVKTPSILRLSDLQSFPRVTVTTNAQAGKGSLGVHTYGGVLLYDLLQKAQIVTDPTRKNDVLRKVVMVTGTDGYSIAIALGEILPRFANKKVLIAYEQDGKSLPQAEGFVRLIVPGDTFAGRYVSNIATIAVRTAGPLPTLGVRTPSSSFYVLGSVKKPARYDQEALSALKTTEVTIQSQDQNGNTTTTVYSGVLLTDLLQSAGGVQVNANAKNDVLRKGIVAVGTDGYSCLVVGGEIDPRFAHIQVLVATAVNGKPLPQTDGFARLVVPGDQAMGRFVSNLIELQVVDLAA